MPAELLTEPLAVSSAKPCRGSADLALSLETLTPQLIAEMAEHQANYWKEVAGPFHNFPPDVDWPSYLVLQSKGMLRVICGRNSQGELKGGAVVTITPHPHYACVLAALPLLFVDPEYRHGRIGIRLVRRAETEAEQSGAQLMMTHGGMHNGVYRLFEHLDYSDFGRYFVKTLLNNPNGLNPVFKKGAE